MEKMTAAQFLATQRKSGDEPRKNKYSAKKVTVAGIEFDSKREADRYLILRDKQRHGLIRDLKLQVRIPLMGASGQLLGSNNHGLVYIADFQYTDVTTGQTVTEDAKGMILPLYSLKKAILRSQGIEVVEV
jgi:hypothetical protein